jgi:uncharacterized protein
MNDPVNEPVTEPLLTFPCSIDIKAFGLNQPDFADHVVALIAAHYGEISGTQVRTRPSKQNKYLSVTVTIEAQSREQADAIYQSLTDDERVQMAL